MFLPLMLMPVIMQTDLQKNAYKGQSCQRKAIITSVFEQFLKKLFHFLKIFLNLVTVNNPEFSVIFESHGEVIWRGSRTLIVA